MEKAQTKTNGPKKLTYEELNRAASDLYQQNQNLIARMKKMEEALDEKDFNYTSFFISMLFKVMEHPEAYSESFLKWTVECIEGSLTSFGNMMMTKKDSETGGEEKKSGDEA